MAKKVITSVSGIAVDHRRVRRAGGDLYFAVTTQVDKDKFIQVLKFHPHDLEKAEQARQQYLDAMEAQK